jgi:EAL domain-containing protein (putative c-di-GMP-specific phosphodiesterase class I)
MNTVNELCHQATRCHLAGIENMIVEEAERAFGAYGEMRLTSCFQPVFSLMHGRAVGAEALLRARDAAGNSVAPMVMFDLSTEFHEILLLDRLSCTVHVSNFLKQPDAQGWLFVNMNRQVFIESVGERSFFDDLFARYALPPARMVIELIDESATDDSGLADAIARCHAHGSLVAFDDFDARPESLDRVWSLRPDIVKINRVLTARAINDDRARYALATAIDALHEMECLALLQGVETSIEAELALAHQVDLVQGYYFARPEFDIPAPTELRGKFGETIAQLRKRAMRALNRHRDVFAPYLSGLWGTTVLLESGIGLELAAKGLSALAATLGCYLIDAEGNQVGERVLPPVPAPNHPGFAGLLETNGANYAHQPCFRNAWSRPGKIQLTEPGFAAIARRRCATASTTVQFNGSTRVLCVDLDWDKIR